MTIIRISTKPISFIQGGSNSNACSVGEQPVAEVIEKCNCYNFSNPECQLVLNVTDTTYACKDGPDLACVSAVKFWAFAYEKAKNSNDTRCKDGDPNYKASQAAWSSCSKKESQGIYFMVIYYIL